MVTQDQINQCLLAEASTISECYKRSDMTVPFKEYAIQWAKCHIDPVVYIATEMAQIQEDYDHSDKSMSMTEYSNRWVKANAIKFAHLYKHKQ